MESLYADAPLALIAVDLHPIVHLGLSCQFHLGRCCDSGRVTIDLAKSACASPDSLWPAVFKECTDIDCSQHGLLSPFRHFYVKTFKQTRASGGGIIELNML